MGKICVADSTDAGVTWTAAHPIDLPNPNAGIDVVRLQAPLLRVQSNSARRVLNEWMPDAVQAPPL
jgi:predicted neuraminidase